LLDHYLGRYQCTYLQARRALRPIHYKDTSGELRALLDATGGDLASVEARLAYFLQAFNQDLLRSGTDKIPLDVEIANPSYFDRLALAFFRIVSHPSEVVAEREARWVAAQATETKLATQDLPARALLTLQQRLWRQALREGRPELLPIARRAHEDAGSHWKNHLQPRRLRNAILQALTEGRPALARRALATYDREIKQAGEPAHPSFRQARLLFEAQLLLIEGEPASALEKIDAASTSGSLLETSALRAHALKLSGDPSYARILREFESRLSKPWGTPAGLEWYLHDARGIIEDSAWWPKHGPPRPR